MGVYSQTSCVGARVLRLEGVEDMYLSLESALSQLHVADLTCRMFN